MAEAIGQIIKQLRKGRNLTQDELAEQLNVTSQAVSMYSYIAHFQKDYAAESLHCQRDFMFHFEAMLDDVTQIGCASRALGYDGDAFKAFETVLAFIHIVFFDEPVVPALQEREHGNVYMLAAQTCVKLEHRAEVLDFLEIMIDYDLITRR